MRSFDCVENILSALWRRYVCDDVVRLTSGVAHREYVLILQQSKSRSSYLYPVEHPSSGLPPRRNSSNNNNSSSVASGNPSQIFLWTDTQQQELQLAGR